MEHSQTSVPDLQLTAGHFPLCRCLQVHVCVCLTGWWVGSCWRKSHQTGSWSYCCSDHCRKQRGQRSELLRITGKYTVHLPLVDTVAVTQKCWCSGQFDFVLQHQQIDDMSQRLWVLIRLDSFYEQNWPLKERCLKKKLWFKMMCFNFFHLNFNDIKEHFYLIKVNLSSYLVWLIVSLL